MSTGRKVFWAVLAVAVVVLGVVLGPEIGAMLLLVGGVSGAATHKGRRGLALPERSWSDRVKAAKTEADAESVAAIVRAETEREEAKAHVRTTASGAGRERNARRLSRLFGFGGKAAQPPPD